MLSLLDDIRSGLRLLVRRPGFSLSVILVLALGIGATSSMFSVVRSVLLRPLPFPDSDRVTSLWAPQRFIPHASVSGPDFHDWRAQSKSFVSMAAVSTAGVALAGSGEPEVLTAAKVSGDFYDVVGVHAAIGRVLGPDDDSAGSHVAVIGDKLFQRKFGGDPGVVGRTILIDGEPTTVVGVMPKGFAFAGPYVAGDIWLPLGLDPTTGETPEGWGRGSHFCQLVGRLAPGATVESARAELVGIAKQLEQTYPDSNMNVTAEVVSLHEQLVGGLRAGLLFLLGAIFLVLAIACANVANLLLARSSSRRMEIAMRVALGATRGRIVRQLLVESVVLSVVGGAFGLLLTLWGVDLFASALVNVLPPVVHVDLDGVGVVFSVALSVGVGVAFGLAPALTLSRPDVYGELKEGATRASPSASQRRLRGALVAGEVALAMALLVGAGSLFRSFERLSGEDPGFDAQNVTSGHVALPSKAYSTPESMRAFEDNVVASLSGAAGVEAAGAIDFLPLSGMNNNGDFVIEGREPWPSGESPVLERRRASPDYFKAMGIVLKRGRYFTDADSASSTPVMIVNEQVAKRFFGDVDPIGQRISWNTDKQPFREVVGVVGDVRTSSLTEEVPLESYVPFAQFPSPQVSFVVKTEGADGAKALIRDAVRRADPLQPLYQVQTMDDLIEWRLAARRLSFQLLGLFAICALVLASIGIFGVVAYHTSQRTREIGIRVALGASSRNVVFMVVRQSMAIVLGGIVIGVVLALIATRVLGTAVAGLEKIDAPVYLALAVVLAMVALVSTWLPARKAALVSPAQALRYE